jgi:hypothetical protein
MALLASAASASNCRIKIFARLGMTTNGTNPLGGEAGRCASTPSWHGNCRVRREAFRRLGRIAWNWIAGTGYSARAWGARRLPNKSLTPGGHQEPGSQELSSGCYLRASAPSPEPAMTRAKAPPDRVFRFGRWIASLTAENCSQLYDA